LYFKAHACLAAYMNILRNNLNTAYITCQTWCVTSRQLIQSAYGIADVGYF